MPSIASSAEATPTEHHPPPSITDRLMRYLPVLVFFLYALTVPGLLRGEQSGVYATAAALAEHGTFAIDNAVAALAPTPLFADDPPGAYPHVAYFAGHHYFAMPPGLAILATPFYLLGLLAAPLLGPQAPIVAFLLAGPLLGASVSRRFIHLTAHYGILGLFLPITAAIYGLPLNHAQPVVLAIFMLIALLASWVVPLGVKILGGAGRPADAVSFGLLIASPLLLDYGIGLMGGVLLTLYLGTYLWQRRDVRGLLLILAGAAVPLLLLLLWQTILFGAPWHAAFRLAVDPLERQLWSLFREELHLTIAFPVLIIGAVAAQRGEPIRWRRDPGVYETFGLGIAITALALILFVVISLRLTQFTLLVPSDWFAGPRLALLAVLGALIALCCNLNRLPDLRRGRRTVAPVALLLALLLSPFCGRGAAAATASDFAPTFATAAGHAVWKTERGTAAADTLSLEPGGNAISPWIEARPGLRYTFAAGGTGPLRLTFLWHDDTRANLASQVATFQAGEARLASFAAPVRAAGLRLLLDAPGGAATIAQLRLDLASGVRVEPFPDGNRAALAFSFDWESAMGGLIHSRSAGGEGEGAAVGLRADGGPSVAEAEAKGLRMREGARYLADLFATYGIRATFYSTGYNLLDGNPTCEKFLNDPLYRNANQANGWGSDWWRTHPWYGDDPCTTEAEAPAWYFASETLALAAAGHEIASHTFGHLYVRGVSPAQLRADLELWNEVARALGLPPARTFAFPWTSSNSLTPDFWAVFKQLGMTILTRLYQTPEQPLPHPYELDRIAGQPELIIFPDFYLASNAAALDEALARIDVTLASRGYHSLWNHPNEALEQGGQIVWQRAVDYAAARREQGLWIAPVTEIAEYSRTARQVSVTAIPIAGGDYLVVENRSGQRLAGVTLGLATAGMAAIDGRDVTPAETNTIVLPTLEPGAQVVVLVRR